MNFNNKSKRVCIILIMTAVLFVVSSMLIGAYAIPLNDKDVKVSSTDYKVIEEDGIFYIFCGGADKNDKPLTGITKGSTAFVVVKKDNYTSITGFNNEETLVDDVKKQLDIMECLTDNEKEVVIEVATKISNVQLSDINKNDIAEGHIKGKFDYDVLTYRLAAEDAPKDVQNWLRECSSNPLGIFTYEFDNRYWIYTNTIGINNNFSFKTASSNASEGTITIIPNNEDGNGYALLSAPTKYTNLVVKCGDYTAEIN